MKIRMLPAGYGDCTLIEVKRNDNSIYTILIDGGTVKSYKKEIKDKLENYLNKNKKIDLVIITHSDDDHISGMNYILENKFILSKINRIIYNSPYAIGKKFDLWDGDDLKRTESPKVIKKTSVSTGFNNGILFKIKNEEIDTNTSARTANKLQQVLFDLDKLEMDLIINDGESDINVDGIKIKFLSPRKEELLNFFNAYKLELSKKSSSSVDINTANSKTDYDIHFEELINNNEKKGLSYYNMASLAFIIFEEITGEAALIMGDGSYELVMDKLYKMKNDHGVYYSDNNRLKLKYLKLSHHGSICDLDKKFFNIIDCNNFLISTDGSCYGHPDKKLIARVYSVNKESKFYFNYQKRKDEVTKEGGIIKDICMYKREFN